MKSPSCTMLPTTIWFSLIMGLSCEASRTCSQWRPSLSASRNLSEALLELELFASLIPA